MNAPRERERILLIEDELKVRQAIVKSLFGFGGPVVEAASGEQALAAIEQHKVDLIILDLNLPDYDGLELLRDLKKLPATKDVPVVILTGSSLPSDIAQGLEAGASDYILKPFSVVELRARVQAALRTQQLQDELRRSSAAIEEARLRAESSSEAKSAYLANMSHEIRTPMNGVVGMAGLLLETELTDQQRELVETIRNSSNALLAIINDILDLSKIESGKLELEPHACELRELLEDVLDLLAPEAAAKAIDLGCLIDDAVPTTIMADSNRLRQVLVNLLGNAVKFTRKGEVTLSVEMSDGERREERGESRTMPSLSDLGQPADGRSRDMGGRGVPPTLHILHFAVKDTGIGIQREKMDCLFKAFSQATPSIGKEFGGTGLGLAISKTLTELMGGRLWSESTPGKGSTFHFEIPVEVLNASSAGRVKEEAFSRLAGKRLLIVDDNSTNRKIIRSVAEKHGMICSGAESGKDAIGLLQNESPFDLAVLDMQMPEMDGTALAEKIRTLPRGATLPMILLTSMGLREVPADRLEPFCATLSKPVRHLQLLNALVAALFNEKLSGTTSKTSGAAKPQKLDPQMAARLPLKILLVDDNAVNQRVASRLLQQMGYSPALAQDGFEALLQYERGGFDLIFMDVQMPGLDGLEASRRIRQVEHTSGRNEISNGRTPIVAMTANAMQGDREKCLAAGMDDYVPKPVRPEVFAAMVEKWGNAVHAARGGAKPDSFALRQMDNDKLQNSTTSAAKAGSKRSFVSLLGQSGSGRAESGMPHPFTHLGNSGSDTREGRDQGDPGKAERLRAAIAGSVQIDLDQLFEMAGGTPEGLEDLVNLYLDQTGQQIRAMHRAIDAGACKDVARLAHKCVGASATCGFLGMVAPLRELERAALAGEIGETRNVLGKLNNAFDSMRPTLHDYMTRTKNNPARDAGCPP